jgi:hypothetical protein
MAFQTLTTNYPEYCTRWSSDDKWIEIIQNNYNDNPSKEKEEELKISRANMIRATGAQWKTTMEDSTQTNQSGIFRHQYFVTFEVENDQGGMVAKRKQVTYLYAIQPGHDHPKKPRVAKVFRGEDKMDYCICGLEKRKRAEIEVGKTISATTNHQASINYYDTSTGIVGRQKIDKFHWLESRYHHSNYLEASWVDVVDTYTKMDCASLQRFSRSNNSASSSANPTSLL